MRRGSNSFHFLLVIALKIPVRNDTIVFGPSEGLLG